MFRRATDRPAGWSFLARTIAAVGASVVLTLLGPPAPALASGPVDLGDAPSRYDLGGQNPARATLTGPRLGSTETADPVRGKTRVSAQASDSAAKDFGDDAVAGFAPLTVGRRATVASVIRVSRVDQAARVCGWIDFDRSGAFTADERSCAQAAAGVRSVRLSWHGVPASTGASYVRLRIGDDRVSVEQPTGPSLSGEVEDYPIRFQAAVSQPDTSITLAKTAAPTTISSVGQVVTYTFTAKNTGQVPLTAVQVNDELPGLSALSCDGPAALVAGGTRTCTGTRVVTQNDLDFGSIFNFAQVSAEAPGGNPTDAGDDVTALDDATVTARVAAGLQVTSQSSAASVSEGSHVTWTYTVANTGNVTVTDVRVISSLKGTSKLACSPTGQSLAPGAGLVCTGDYAVTYADAVRGHVTAAVTVRGERPYGDPAATSDDVVGKASQSLTVAKPAEPGGGAGGPPSVPSGGGSTGDGNGLADTGGPGTSALVGFAGLLVAGAVSLVLGRRRRSA
jgi:uncharacterized repeat protein (TIGR01451 family)